MMVMMSMNVAVNAPWLSWPGVQAFLLALPSLLPCVTPSHGDLLPLAQGTTLLSRPSLLQQEALL